MTLSELISKVGDENVKVQRLYEAMTGAEKRNDHTEITFGTTEVSAEELMLGTPKMHGLVIWIPKDKLQ